MNFVIGKLEVVAGLGDLPWPRSPPRGRWHQATDGPSPGREKGAALEARPPREPASPQPGCSAGLSQKIGAVLYPLPIKRVLSLCGERLGEGPAALGGHRSRLVMSSDGFINPKDSGCHVGYGEMTCGGIKTRGEGQL